MYENVVDKVARRSFAERQSQTTTARTLTCAGYFVTTTE